MNVNNLLEGSSPYQVLQDQAGKLAGKWEKSGLLEGINSSTEANNMAMLLENQAKQLVNEVNTTNGSGGSSFSAGTVKEAKLIYETIKDTFTISKESKQTKKSSIKEGLGMASKAAGKSTAAKKEVISESNDMMKRFQKLANIKINQ